MRINDCLSLLGVNQPEARVELAILVFIPCPSAVFYLMVDELFWLIILGFNPTSDFDKFIVMDTPVFCQAPSLKWPFWDLLLIVF